MKKMTLSIVLTALTALFMGCSDDNNTTQSDKDWNGTASYFKSTDENKFDTYYKPYVGYVGDPMPFYDPQAKDFKIMYLQEFRPKSRLNFDES